jgi:chromosome segregation ATPase
MASGLSSDSDDDPGVPPSKLEQCRDAISKCAEIFQQPEIVSTPERLVDLVSQKLRAQQTTKARLRDINEDISKLTSVACRDVTTIEQMIRDRTAELKQRRAALDQLAADTEGLKKRLDLLGKQKHQVEEVRAVLQTIEQAQGQLDSESSVVDRLQKEESELKVRLASQIESEVRQQLADEQMKRMNIQHAIDSLRAEEQKRMTARSLFLREKRVTLEAELAEIATQKSGFLKEKERIEHLQSEIARFTALISREERKPGHTQAAGGEKGAEPVNRDRVGRLILMLLSDGPSDAVVQSISEELDWTKKQTEDFAALAHGESDRGLGTQWAEWLNKLVSDE